jgi:hypothetical protein
VQGDTGDTVDGSCVQSDTCWEFVQVDNGDGVVCKVTLVMGVVCKVKLVMGFVCKVIMVMGVACKVTLVLRVV